MITKGGMTGLPESDFHTRQKSGSWTIDEHFQDINYIRTKSYTLNNYLAVGNYETEVLTIIDIFNNQVSSLTKSLTGSSLQLPSVTCMAYNNHVDHLAIGLNKPPYLKIFDTYDGDMPVLDISGLDVRASSLIDQPVFVKRFRNNDLVDNVLSVTHNFDDLYPATALISIGPNVSYPYEIEIVNSNQINFIFYDIVTQQLPSGIVYIHSSKNSKTYLLSNLVPITFDTHKSYLLDISSDNILNPTFQIYDSAGQMIFPKDITEVLSNMIYEFDFPIDFDVTNVTILVTQGPSNYSEVFTVVSSSSTIIPPTPVSDNVFIKELKMGLLDDNILHLEHDFNDSLPAVLFVDDDKNIINSGEVEIIDENQVDAFFSRSISGIVEMLVFILII